MNKRKSLILLLVTTLLLAAVMFSFGIGYARYRTEITGDLEFGVHPLDLPEIRQIAWRQDGDSYILTFTPERTMRASKIYLAVSEGVTAPESLSVSLSYLKDEEVITQRAVMQPITDGTELKLQFGAGHVFRFYDVSGEEVLLDLIADEETPIAYTLTVGGLDAAAEYQSILRLFIEPTQNAVQPTPEEADVQTEQPVPENPSADDNA